MSLTPAVCSVNDVQGLQMDPTFHPSLWGDFFLKYKPPTASKVTLMQHLRTKVHGNSDQQN